MIKSRWVSALVWPAVLPRAVWAVLRVGGWTPVRQWVPLVAFTPYVAAASALPLLVALGLRRWAAAALALVTGGQLRVLAGDFNATLDHRQVRDLLDSGYRDVADVTGHGLTATWPQRGRSPVPGVTIDHVQADARMAVRAFGVHGLANTDHRPVFAELGLPRPTGR
ncbi:endonuclease/exonuclease/phosphatase family protein [Streptosporangium sp. NPDC023615]|uniref:endonuclease/exonuclease/phosphatase family protein n=1 Tax=Streptosporangium sp. NPDC023615 TaxID=3154794 RepID=UPI0034128FB0